MKLLFVGKSTSVEAIVRAQAAAGLFVVPVVEDSAADERQGLCHEAGMLGRGCEQVNLGIICGRLTVDKSRYHQKSGLFVIAPEKSSSLLGPLGGRLLHAVWRYHQLPEFDEDLPALSVSCKSVSFDSFRKAAVLF